jgi:RNA polymerase sigma factor (sigma-70 family)
MAKPYFGGTIEIDIEIESDLIVPWRDVARLREDLTDLSDDSLIGLAKRGSADAYAVLFDRYRRPALTLAAYSSNSVDAKDIVAESFAQVYDQLRCGKGPHTSFRAYLFTCVRHEAGRRAKMQKRVTPTDNIETIDRAVPFDNGAIDGFERDLVRTALASLSARWQTVLWHLDVDGRKPREVAPLMGLTPNSVSALAYRARDGLRKAYLGQHVATTSSSLASDCLDVRRDLVDFVRGSAIEPNVTLIGSHLEACAACMGAHLELEELNSHLRATRRSANRPDQSP